jgi:excinuclease ABC subunit C
MALTVSAELTAKLDTLPSRTGVYLMHDLRQQVIYVGKAVNLRSRVRSYFQASADHPPRLRRLVEDVADLEWIITDTELEALILENELIKRHRPRYNVRLKDDKNYPFIRISWQDDFPKIAIVRRMAHDGGRYYGPFTSAAAVRQTLDALRRVFPYLSCEREITGSDDRPCLYFHIKRCAGPCIGAVNREEYRAVIQGLCDFLEGKTEIVLADLQSKMERAAEAWQFERAALYRDQRRAAEQIVERQKVVSGRDEDADVIAFAQDARQEEACVQVFLIRHGRLVGRDTFVLDGASAEENGEMLGAFLKQFYDEAAYIPPSVLLPQDLDERTIIEQWLRSKRGAQVKLSVPQRGPKRQLVQMAVDNASETLQALQAQWLADTNRQTEALTDLQERLGLATPPARIECFDISTLQGTNTVGSMVVFAKGVPVKSDYRHFNVRSVGQAGHPDDFASMREVLRRRFRRAVEEAENPDPGQKARKQNRTWALLPDLVIVDGGKGQLNVAVEVLEEYGLREVVPVVGLAKQHEDIFLPGQSDPVILPRGSQSLHLVQRVRDEAHRFAITHQRARREKGTLTSTLDAIPGIGPRRRQALLKQFGSLEAIRQASVDELAAVPGMNKAAAEQVKAGL